MKPAHKTERNIRMWTNVLQSIGPKGMYMVQSYLTEVYKCILPFPSGSILVCSAAKYRAITSWFKVKVIDSCSIFPYPWVWKFEGRDKLLKEKLVICIRQDVTFIAPQPWPARMTNKLCQFSQWLHRQVIVHHLCAYTWTRYWELLEDLSTEPHRYNITAASWFISNHLWSTHPKKKMLQMW